MSIGAEERIREVMARVLQTTPDSIGPGFSPQTSPLWDSLRHIELVMSIEEEFGVQFADEVAMEMRNYDMVVAAVAVALGES